MHTTKRSIGPDAVRASGRNLSGGVQRLIATVAAILTGALAGETRAQDAPVERTEHAELMAAPAAGKADEAWWTGPVSASSPNTLPRGHLLVEPYLFDVRSRGSDYLGSLTYVLYGLTDDVTVGAIPIFGGSRSKAGGRGRRIAVNDLTLTAQYRLHRASEGELVPALSLVLQHTVPLGRFDRLGDDPQRGIGGGANATMLGLYAQRVDRLGNGRPLRTRINVTRSFAWRGPVRDESVFGTPNGFRGSAHAGGVATVDVSFEYSVSTRLVLAADLVGRWSGAGRVDGGVVNGPRAWTGALAPSASFSVSPAVEYSWSSTRGVLLGVRATPRGRNAQAFVTPVVAFSAVF